MQQKQIARPNIYDRKKINRPLFINLYWLATAGLLGVSTAKAQTPFLLAPQHPTQYDRRFIVPEFKQVNLFTVATLICVDAKSRYREKQAGNIDTGISVGLGLNYAKALINNEYCGLFIGIGYEFFPAKYQRVKCFIEYKTPLFFKRYTHFPKFEFVFPKFEFLYGWDSMHQNWTHQRYYFINIRSRSANFNYGIQFPTEFHRASHVFELSYNLYPKKW